MKVNWQKTHEVCNFLLPRHTCVCRNAQLLQINIEKEIEIAQKQHNEHHQNKTKRLQEEFEIKARVHVEAQRREVAAMKNKLQERLKAKKMKMKKY